MTGRPPRDVREDAKRVIANALRREQHAAPEAFALELLVALDGAHIGLTDTSKPVDPNADWHPPTGTTGPTPDYRAARAALKGQQQ